MSLYKKIQRLMIVAALITPVSACKNKVPEVQVQEEVLLNVTTVDLQSKPVENVRFYINSKKFGITDFEGRFQGRFPAKNGDTLTFNVEAPEGYTVPPTPDQSRWQVKITYPTDGRPLQIDFRAELQRPQRDYLLMVRTGAAGTPVRVNDVVIGTAGANGDGLLKTAGVPGMQFIAQAGALTFKGTFSEDDEVYLLSATRSGPVTDGAPGAAPPPVEAVAAVGSEAPGLPSEAVPSEAVPSEAAVEVAVAPPRPAQEDPFPAEAAPPREAPEERVAAARRPEPVDELVDEPAPPEPARQEPVEAAPRAPIEEAAPALDDILAPSEPEPPAPVAVTPRSQAGREQAALPSGLMDDDGTTVDPSVAKRGATAMGAGGPSAATMSREEIDTKLEDIQGRLGQSKVLNRSDVEFLGQIDRTHPGYFEAHRLLADYHYKSKDYKRQAEELEVATSSGRYKRDPTILLSLAKCYGRGNNYRKALSTMQRVEENGRNLPADQKSDAYRFHAEMYEFEFQRQYNDDAKKANATLLDKAISQWERYETFVRAVDPSGVSHAKSKVSKLTELKNGLEL